MCNYTEIELYIPVYDINELTPFPPNKKSKAHIKWITMINMLILITLILTLL